MNEEINSTIQRCPHDEENPYAQISRDLIRDNSISPNCRWLLTYLLSHQDRWNIKVKQIVAFCKGHLGRDVIYRLIKEAMSAGYVLREETLDKGRKRIKYFLSEKPKFKKCLLLPEIQDTEIQDTEIQDAKERASLLSEDKKKHSKERVGASPPPSFAPSLDLNDKEKPKAEEEKPPAQELPQNALDLAKDLLNRVKGIHPKVKQPNLKEWAKTVDLMNRKDGRTWDEIKEIIQYTFEEDTFWVKVIQSAEALRRNFDKIVIKMKPMNNNGTKYKENEELAWKVKKLLNQDGDGKDLIIYKTCVKNQNTGDSINFDIEVEPFREILFKWFDIREKKNGN